MVPLASGRSAPAKADRERVQNFLEGVCFCEQSVVRPELVSGCWASTGPPPRMQVREEVMETSQGGHMGAHTVTAWGMTLC